MSLNCFVLRFVPIMYRFLWGFGAGVTTTLVLLVKQSDINDAVTGIKNSICNKTNNEEETQEQQQTVEVTPAEVVTAKS